MIKYYETIPIKAHAVLYDGSNISEIVSMAGSSRDIGGDTGSLIIWDYNGTHDLPWQLTAGNYVVYYPHSDSLAVFSPDNFHKTFRETYPYTLPLHKTLWPLSIIYPWWFYKKDMTKKYLSRCEYNRIFSKP